MKKVVCVFANEEQALAAGKELTGADMTNYTVSRLGEDYQQQVLGQITLTSREIWIILLSSYIGLVLGGLLFIYLGQINRQAVLFARFLAGGPYIAPVVGAAISAAAGFLLSSLWLFSIPVPERYQGRWLMVLYCSGPYYRHLAWKLLEGKGAELL